MSSITKPIVLLFADDDLDDQLLVKEAFAENKLSNKILFVNNGEELLDYLKQRGKFSDPDLSPRPDLILLDLNMPKVDGREALKEIKQDKKLRQIPVIILTTSKAEEDIIRTYDLGVNSYISKPVTFTAMVKIVQTIEAYWFQIVKLPSRSKSE